jgi:hypothetical protein
VQKIIPVVLGRADWDYLLSLFEILSSNNDGINDSKKNCENSECFRSVVWLWISRRGISDEKIEDMEKKIIIQGRK